MGKIKTIRKARKIPSFAIMLVLMAFVIFLIKWGGYVRADSSEYQIYVGDKSGNYEMVNNEIELKLAEEGSSGTLASVSTGVSITWEPGPGAAPYIDVISVSGAAARAKVVAKRATKDSEHVQVLAYYKDGSTTKEYSIKISIKAVIENSGSSEKFEYVLSSGNRALIMSPDTQQTSTLKMNVDGPYKWVVKNSVVMDVVTQSGISAQFVPKTSGKTTIEVWDNTTSKIVTSLDAYVLPKVRWNNIDSVIGDNKINSVTPPAIISKEPSQLKGTFIELVNRAGNFGGAPMSQYISWEIVQDGGTVVADSAGKKSEDIDVSYSLTGNGLVINKARYGDYILKLYPVSSTELKDLTDVARKECCAQIGIEAKADLSPKSVSLSVGDTINLSELFMIPERMVISGSSITFGVGSGADDANIACNESSSEYIGITESGNILKAKKKTKENQYVCVQLDSSKIGKKLKLFVRISDSLVLNVTEASMPVGGELDMSAALKNIENTWYGNNGGNDVSISWKSNNPDYVDFDKDNPNILHAYVETSELPNKCATVTVTVKLDNGITKTASCKVYVERTMTDITLDPSELTLVGQGDEGWIKLKLGEKDTADKIAWQLRLDDTKNECVTMEVMPDNLSVKLTSKAVGTATLVVVNKDSNYAMQFSKIKVLPKVDSIEFDEVFLTKRLLDGYVDLKPTLSPSLTDLSSLVWEAKPSGMVEMHSNKNGCYIRFLKAGEVKITAYANYNNKLQKSATVSLTILPVATSIKISPSIKVEAGESTQMEVTVLPATAQTSVRYYSTDKSIASVDEKTGMVKGVKPGTTEIYAVSDEGCQSMGVVTVTRKAKGISLKDKTPVVVERGKTFTMLDRVKLVPTDTTSEVHWGSTDKSIATIDDKGVIKGVKVGTAYVYAYTEGILTEMLEVTVVVPSTGITLPSEITLNLSIDAEKSKAIDYKLTAADSTADLVWKVVDPKIASVDSKGNVQAINVGTTYVIVYSKSGNLSGYTKVNVIKAAEGISLNVDEITIDVGENYKIAYAITPVNSTENTVTWTVQHSKIAKVDSTGSVRGLSEGTTFVMAKLANGSVQYVTVNVVNKVKAMVLDKSTAEIVKGETLTLHAVFTPTNATDKVVTWSSDHATIASVNAKGKVKGLKGGTTIIHAVSKDGKIASECMVTVIEPASKIKLNKTSCKLPVKKQVVLKATVTSNSTSNKKVKWSSSNARIASVNSQGRVTAKKVGSCRIYAKATDGSKVYAVCNIRVIKRVTKLQINQVYLKMLEGHAKKLKVKVSPSNASIKGVKWTSSDESVAVVSSVGKVTGIAAGSCKVTAQTKDGSKLKVYCNVTVEKEVPATGLSLAAQDMVIVKGMSKSAGVTVSPGNTTDTLYYSSDNRSVATVSSKGKIKAIRPGTATITVSTTSGKEAYIGVTVVGLNKTSLTLEQYDSDDLWVEGLDDTIKWSSTNPNIARVDNGTVVGRKPGTCTIIASISGVKLHCRVKVNKMK